MSKIFRKLLDVFFKEKKTKHKRSFEDFESLKAEFLEARARLSPPVSLTPLEKINTEVRLHYLATEIASIIGSPDWIRVIAYSLEGEIAEPPERFKALLRSADVPTLLNEYKALHLTRMTALASSDGERLSMRMKQAGRELAGRMGGKEFILAVSDALNKKENIEK